ncbi:MAG: hypothetical protein HY078_04025 [Elusimicrobia bacterium]|nr:hypothetical protein [Elusimicrobiota bacterium]
MNLTASLETRRLMRQASVTLLLALLPDMALACMRRAPVLLPALMTVPGTAIGAPRPGMVNDFAALPA